jgi:hypothetical protein
MTIGIPTGETLTTPPPMSSEDMSASAILQAALADMGLQSLGKTTWDWWKQGRPVEQILLDVQDTPEFEHRFPAMKALRARGQAISPGTYIAYEKSANELWHAAGLPPDQIREGDYVTKWLEGNTSINEVSHRIQDLYVRVANTAPEVRDWYAQRFNNGDAALAASFADPETAVPVLERQAAAAEFGGAGSRFGYNVGLATALEAAGVGVTAAGAQQGFEQLQRINPLFNETISERDQNLVAEQQGIQAVFGFGEDAQTVLERRRRAREQASAGSTRAGGVLSQGGFGLGTVQNNG